MKTPLSKVYLDDYPIELMGDEARPPLARIVRAAGKVPARVDIIWLHSRSDPNGAPVDPDEFIDRTSDPTRPIYLRSLPRLPPSPPGLPPPGDEAVASTTTSPPTRPTVTTADVTPGPLRAPPPSRAGVQGPVPNAPDPDPVIAQLGKPVRTQRDVTGATAGRAITPKQKREEQQARAEAEAEKRQEEQRDEEDALQDEAEARMEAAEDAEKSD